MKAPEPVFTSSTSASSPAASFFDWIDAVSSGIDSIVAVTIAHHIKPLVRRREVVGLADDRAADIPHAAAECLRIRRGVVAGDCFELVDRAAGMSEAAPGNHRNIAAAGRDRRREDQADGIANPDGRVFVENRPFDIRPIQRASEPCHCARQRGAFLTRQSAEKRRAVALAADDFLDQHASIGRISGFRRVAGRRSNPRPSFSGKRE